MLVFLSRRRSRPESRTSVIDFGRRLPVVRGYLGEEYRLKVQHSLGGCKVASKASLEACRPSHSTPAEGHLLIVFIFTREAASTLFHVCCYYFVRTML